MPSLLVARRVAGRRRRRRYTEIVERTPSPDELWFFRASRDVIAWCQLRDLSIDTLRKFLRSSGWRWRGSQLVTAPCSRCGEPGPVGRLDSRRVCFVCRGEIPEDLSLVEYERALYLRRQADRRAAFRSQVTGDAGEMPVPWELLKRKRRPGPDL